MLMISDQGGVDIENVAEKNPEKIHTVHFPNFNEIFINKNLQDKLDIDAKQFKSLAKIINKLVKAFISLDASSIEINPLVLDSDNNFILLDAKITLDDNALFRHPELLKLRDFSEENPLELCSKDNHYSAPVNALRVDPPGKSHNFGPNPHPTQHCRIH